MTDQLSELRKTVIVRPAPETAFALFTGRTADWWPLATHSVGRADGRSVVVEPGVGGRIVETLADGSTAVWGTVEVWEPPRLLRFTWHPGTPVREATLVEVTFRATGTGADAGTVVELVHTAARASYEAGWEVVLGGYAATASADDERP
jgi:uncharacterized protein YndB with AHSA1/START domain